VKFAPAPGLNLDRPPVTDTAFWLTGINVRFRLGDLETIGLYGPLQAGDGSGPIALAAPPSGQFYDTILISGDDIVAAAPDQLRRVTLNGVVNDITPGSLPAAGPNERWWFADNSDTVVGGRIGDPGGVTYAWDRVPSNDFTPLANVPEGGVGGAIFNNILVLLGVESFAEQSGLGSFPPRAMTVRWSDRFNFEEWTPSDINLSGENIVEGGTKIVGGGFTSYGIAVWTDKRLAIFTENTDPYVVFSRTYVDGGRGLLTPRAWCEADGVVWWIDETRTLNRYDGGRPVQIANPLKYATVERLDLASLEGAYLTPNPEYGEVIFHYPQPGDPAPTRQVVYNYMQDCWYMWELSRSAWTSRSGRVPTLAMTHDHRVYRHDIDIGIPASYVPLPTEVEPFLTPITTTLVSADQIEPFSFFVASNLIFDAAFATAVTEVVVNHVALPPTGLGASPDQLNMTVSGLYEPQLYEMPRVDITTFPFGGPYTVGAVRDTQTFDAGETRHQFRVGGKAVQLVLSGAEIRTVVRLKEIFATAIERSQR